MAIDPATAKKIAKLVISQITDEEKRQRLIIGIVVGTVVFVLLLAMPILLLVTGIGNSPLNVNSPFSKLIP